MRYVPITTDGKLENAMAYESFGSKSLRGFYPKNRMS